MLRTAGSMAKQHVCCWTVSGPKADIAKSTQTTQSGPPVLLRDYAALIRCLLLCLLRLSQQGQGSRRESQRTLGAWERDAGLTARRSEEGRNGHCRRRAR